MKSKLLILFIPIFLISTSCIKELVVPDNFKMQMVLSGTLVGGEPITIRLAQNFNIVDSPKNIGIYNAQVEIYENNLLLGNLKHDTDGLYSINLLPKQGATYILKANCDGYPSIEASTVMPDSCNFSMNSEKVLRINAYNNNDSVTNTALTIAASSQFMYYAITYLHVFKDEYFNWPEPNIIKDIYEQTAANKPDNLVEYTSNSRAAGENIYEDFYTYKPKFKNAFYIYEPNSLESQSGNVLFFNNQTFVRQKYVFIQVTGIKCNLVKFYQLSPELYMTFRSLAAQQSTSTNLFVTPATVTTNVKGGLGYFGACLVHNIKLNN